LTKKVTFFPYSRTS